jgi:molybdate transport system substrate-binding protein
MKKILAISVALVLMLFVFAGCGNNEQANSTPETTVNEFTGEITVSAAASLTDCLEEMATAFNAQYPNIAVTYNFASSGSLQQQIEQGAPADIFFSAGKKQMTALSDAGLMVDDSVKDILQNTVVLITPVNGATIASFEELSADSIGKIGVGEPDSVPVGQYTAQVFETLGLTDTLADKLVYAKDVKEVLSWVETGNVDAGIVYSTDALISDKVTVVATAPADSHDPIVYPVGIVKASANQEAAQYFEDFLFTDTAKEIFTNYGFTPVF